MKKYPDKKYSYECNKCQRIEERTKWTQSQRTHPTLCSKCAKKISAEKVANMKVTNPIRWQKLIEVRKTNAKRQQAALSGEQKSARGKHMNSCVKDIKGRRKNQHDSLKANPQKWNEYCQRRQQWVTAYHANMTDEQREIRYGKIFKHRMVSTECINFLNQIDLALQINCVREKWIGRYVVDAVIPSTQIVIEYYGDVYHCNPSQFLDPSQYCSWIQRSVQEQRDRDDERIKYIESRGFTVIIVWGEEWKTDPLAVLNRIKGCEPTYES